MNESNKQMNSPSQGSTYKRRKRFLIEIVVFGLILVLIYLYQTRGLIPSDGAGAPELSGQLVNGQYFDISDLHSENTLVYFFAPWCAYCSASMDNINRLRRWDDTNTLEIVLIAIDWESVEEISEYVARHDLSVPVVLADIDDAKRWQVYAFPTYYVLDKDGRIVSSDMGYSTMAGLYLRTR